MSLVGTRPPTVDEWEKYEMDYSIHDAIEAGFNHVVYSGRRSTDGWCNGRTIYPKCEGIL